MFQPHFLFTRRRRHYFATNQWEALWAGLHVQPRPRCSPASICRLQPGVLVFIWSWLVNLAVIQETGQWNCSRLSQFENMTVIIVFLSEAADWLCVCVSCCSLRLLGRSRIIYNINICLLNFYFERIWVVTCQRRTKTRMWTQEGSGVICEVLQTHGQNQVRKSLSYLSKIVKYNVTRVYKWVNDM